MRLSWEKCLFGEKMLILGIEGFRILGIVYTVQTLVLELDFLFITFEKFLSGLKIFLAFLANFLAKIGEKVSSLLN